jgi:hypothetical protein
MKLVVTIPALNEEATIAGVIAGVPRRLPGVDEVEIIVVNDGSIDHNLAVEGTNLRTEMLGPGEKATLDVGSLSAGTFGLLCEVAGHESAGMKGELMLGGEGAGTGAPSEGREPAEK